MLREFGKRRNVRIARPRFLQRVGRVIDASNRCLGLKERDLNGAMIGMGNLFHFYDSTKATQDLSYHHRDIETTLHDAWQWLKK